jgi:oligopeptide/dipeptide ABC transporter ATP-binding protein
MTNFILRAVHLNKEFHRTSGFLSKKKNILKAVNEVNIEIKKGEIFSIIGESGCGKSTLGYLLARIYEPTTGDIWYQREEITRLKEQELKNTRKKIQMVFQDPGSALNPRQTVETILSLPLRIHFNMTKKEREERILNLLDTVNLTQEARYRYPINLSGGEKQRVGIARALALNPEILILDEPTSALDVSVQAKILHLLLELRTKLGLTYIFITHNLCLVRNLADEVVVMYLGQVVERGRTCSIFDNPLHPYTRALISAIPTLTAKERELIPEEIILEGELPSPEKELKYCFFYSRCPKKTSQCIELPEPDLKEITPNHYARCHLLACS